MPIQIDESAANAKGRRALVTIKVAHTAIWAFFASCIVALPLAAWWNRFELAAILTGTVLVECAILGWNKGRCPLTDVAGRYTADRSPAFDIYLPSCVAARNKVLFGTLFVVNGLFALGRWLVVTGKLPLR